MTTIKPYNIQLIPPKIWLVIFLCYLTPIFVGMYSPNDPIIELQLSMVWFLCLIPSLFFTYYFSLKGGIISTILAMIFHVVTELYNDAEGHISIREMYLLGEVAFGNIILTISISTLVNKMKWERVALESTNKELLTRKEQLSNIFDNLDVAIWSLDVKNNTLDVSAGLEKLYGVSRKEITRDANICWKDFTHPEDKIKTEKLNRMLLMGLPSKGTFRIIQSNGEVRWVEDRGVPLVNELGEVIRIDGVVIDITESKKGYETFKNLAYHDTLTDLPNRRFFEKRLAELLDEAKNKHEQFALLFIDLDGFKKVNDQFGHDTGDLLLREVASLLTNSVRKDGIVSRLSGDEFTVLLPEIMLENVIRIAEQIILDLQKPIMINTHTVTVTPSIGISLYPEHGTNQQTLIKHADIAMYEAKQQGKNNYRIYK
jgi:diguanylate cyclase (GGDEF)-like protein/PAS domain S-box-containing protein